MPPETDAHEATKTYYCKTPDCPNEASSPVGRYSYCEHCRKYRQNQVSATGSATTGAKATRAKTSRGGSMVAQLEQIKKLAASADKALARADKLTRTALEAKAAADAAVDQYQSALREAVG